LHKQPFDEPPLSMFIATYYGIDARVLRSAPYELVECAKCSLIYQRWVGDDDLLADLYGTWINEYALPEDDPLYQTEMAHSLQSRDAHEIMAASAFLKVPLDRMVTLDYGMGWALWAGIARHLGCKSFGTELVPARIDFAREHGVVPLTDRELGGPTFHFINTEQVMEHLVEPADVVQRLADALLPGGILKISVPFGERIRDLMGDSSKNRDLDFFHELMPVHPLEHVNCFTRRALTLLAENVALEIVRPRLLDRYAFLAQRGTISVRRPAKAVKELVRPIYQWRNSRNLYVWMRKRV
jgi:hypothetical protein